PSMSRTNRTIFMVGLKSSGRLDKLRSRNPSNAARFRGFARRREAVDSRFAARKFDPLQPRKPPGLGGGQWTRDGNSPSASQGSNAPIKAAGQSAASCWNQMLVDMLLCGSLKPNWYRAACRAQATERYGACLAGRPIPPLPF